MRENYHMRFKKLTQLTLSTNNVLNIALRQRWAIHYLRLLKADKTIWNVDESWLTQSDFTRFGWGEAGQRLRAPIKRHFLRVSILLATSNRGDVYYALSSSNTNSSTFGLFMQ